MTYPYPPHHPELPYKSKHYYFLTFCTDARQPLFKEAALIEQVWTQFVRAARQYQFEITAYCFMPDHVHLLVRGLDDLSDAKAFIKSAKQYSGYHAKRKSGRQIWQRYGFERVIRDEKEVAFTLGYIVANPVRSGLAGHPSEYPSLGSECYTVSEMLEIGEYSIRWAQGT